MLWCPMRCAGVVIWQCMPPHWPPPGHEVGGGEQAAEDVHDSIWREGSPTFRFLRELCLSPTGEQQAGTDAGSAHYYHGAGAEGPTCPEGKQLPALLLPAHEVGGEKGAEDVHDSPTAQSPLFELPPGEQQAGTDAGSAHDHGAQGAEGPTCPEGEQPPALLHDSLWRERSPTAQSPLLELPPREQQAGTDAGSAHYHDAQEEALALRTQLEKRLDAANKQLAAAFAEAAGLKQELAALKLEYSKYKARAEARAPPPDTVEVATSLPAAESGVTIERERGPSKEIAQMTLCGHLFDSKFINDALDLCRKEKAEYQICVGKRRQNTILDDNTSSLTLEIKTTASLDTLLERLRKLKAEERFASHQVSMTEKKITTRQAETCQQFIQELVEQSTKADTKDLQPFLASKHLIEWRDIDGPLTKMIGQKNATYLNQKGEKVLRSSLIEKIRKIIKDKADPLRDVIPGDVDFPPPCFVRCAYSETSCLARYQQTHTATTAPMGGAGVAAPVRTTR